MANDEFTAAEVTEALKELPVWARVGVVVIMRQGLLAALAVFVCIAGYVQVNKITSAYDSYIMTTAQAVNKINDAITQIKNTENMQAIQIEENHKTVSRVIENQSILLKGLETQLDDHKAILGIINKGG